MAGSALLVAPSLWFRGRGGTGDLLHMHSFPSVAFGFAPGLLLAGLEQMAEPATRSRPVLGVALARALLLGAVLAFAVYFAAPDGRFVIHGVLASLACSLVLAAAVVRSWAGAPPWRALVSRPLVWMGERSYSLYLFHVAVLDLVGTRVIGHGGNAAPRVALLMALAVPAALVLAWAGHRFVERPFMSPGKRLVTVDTPETTGDILIRA
jgi:peptidoglycan/LPS O-acetylase OafA/YrhL